MLPVEGRINYDCYILFPNHHEGLRLYRELKAAGVRCTIAPPPRAATSFCGISLLVSEDLIEPARQVIERCGVKVEGIARIPRKASASGCK